MRLKLTHSVPKRIQRGATLVELLTTLGIIALLASLLLPALHRVHQAKQKIQCIANQHQLGLAGILYWDDHHGIPFPYRYGITTGGERYWFGWLGHGSEGQRQFDLQQSPLYPYLPAKGVTRCPSLTSNPRYFKLKARANAYGYGYHMELAKRSKQRQSVYHVQSPDRMTFLADAAQVNTFQLPATPQRPLLEEFYYVNAIEPTGHYRHQGQLNAVFIDFPNSVRRIRHPRIPESLEKTWLRFRIKALS